MAYDNLTNVTDDVDDNLAEYHNELVTALEHVMSAAAFAGYTRAQSMTGSVTLTDADLPIQSFNPTAARDLSLPTVAETNHAFFVYNRASLYDITVKNSGGTTIGTVSAETAGLFFSDGVNGWTTISGGSGGGGGGGGGDVLEVQVFS